MFVKALFAGETQGEGSRELWMSHALSLSLFCSVVSEEMLKNQVKGIDLQSSPLNSNFFNGIPNCSGMFIKFHRYLHCRDSKWFFFF